MNQSEWRDLLGELSLAVLARDNEHNDDVNRPRFAPEVHAAGYIGFEGAAEEEIALAEARLGARLPPSYRTFLSVSNGWPEMWSSVEPGQLWPARQIRWAREQDPQLIEIWGAAEVEVSAEEHLQMRGEDSIDFRAQYVRNLLSISDHGDACDLLLSPEVVGEDGEWECWKIASWLPGAARWPTIEGWFRDALDFYRAN